MDPVAARAQNQRKGRWATQNKGKIPAQWGAASDMIYDPTGALHYECSACICVHECRPHMESRSKRDLDSCAPVALWCAAVDSGACNVIRLFMGMVKIFTSYMCCSNPCLMICKVLGCLHVRCLDVCIVNAGSICPLESLLFSSNSTKLTNFIEIVCALAQFEGHWNLVAMCTS